MQTIQVKTGFGFYKDAADNVVSKAELPAGEHQLAEDLTYIEVNSRAELDAVIVYQPPKTQEQISEEKITTKLRDMAILELTKDGDWP